MNRGCDIWPGKYAKTADRAESASLWHFLRHSICRNSARISQIDLIYGIILNQFLELFSAVGFILWISKTAKICFWRILTLWSNPCMHNSYLAISSKYLIFRNAPKPIIDLYGINFFVPILRPLPFLRNCIDKLHISARLREGLTFIWFLPWSFAVLTFAFSRLWIQYSELVPNGFTEYLCMIWNECDFKWQSYQHFL